MNENELKQLWQDEQAAPKIDFAVLIKHLDFPDQGDRRRGIPMNQPAIRPAENIQPLEARSDKNFVVSTPSCFHGSRRST